MQKSCMQYTRGDLWRIFVQWVHLSVDYLKKNHLFHKESASREQEINLKATSHCLAACRWLIILERTTGRFFIGECTYFHYSAIKCTYHLGYHQFTLFSRK
jgi:hypothetical protein